MAAILTTHCGGPWPPLLGMLTSRLREQFRGGFVFNKLAIEKSRAL